MAKNKRKKEIPNPITWWIYKTASKIICKGKYHYTINKDNPFYKRDKKKGAVVLYNHTCNDDHFLSTCFFGNTRTNYVVTRRFYYDSGMRIAISLANGIFRDQFKADMASIMKMKRVVEQGGTICIAPAGTVSIHGNMPYIPPTIVKLLKLCKADVYTIQFHGTYLAHPKWGTEKRKYPVYIDCIKTLGSEEIKTLDQDEMYKRVLDSLNIPDREYQKQKMVKIEGDAKAIGMEYVYYQCPKCGSEFKMETSGDEIKCSCCNNKIRINEYGYLEGVGNDYVLPESEAVWFDLQVNSIMNKIKENNFTLEDDVDLYTDLYNPKKLEIVGKGKLVYNGIKLYYKGTFDNKEYEKEFPLETLIQIPYVPNLRFNIPNEERMLEFVPNDKNRVIKWALFAEAINKIRLEEEK